MKVLFIGGTGIISTSSSRLAAERGMELWLLNRGKRDVTIPGVQTITADISRPDEVAERIEGHAWDAVVNWIAFSPADIERDIGLFAGRTRQYVFISSASVYQKPLRFPIVTESTPLCNPYNEYSRKKIACEELLMRACRERDFPATIVRPSLTYNDTIIPLPIGGWSDCTVVDRMKRGKPVIVHGDGTSLWTVTHADDFAKGFVGLLGNPRAVGESFHITSDELLTWNQIYQAVAAAAGVEAKIVHIASDFIVRCEPSLEGSLLGDKAHSVIFDNTKIKRFVPGFVATIPFHEGIRRTLAWFEADPTRMRISERNNEIIDRILAAYQRT
ncbi:MAG TPA: NAD-dependent epimerase/dehydratase family protein [Planctomycetota bacterium]|nr:NAD-dependent epimerase/dehydratase family protein [Planctomycetota bacterium]